MSEKFRTFAPSNKNNRRFKSMNNQLNAVELAIKVTSFRKMVREECRKKGLEYPSDDKIAEWLDQDYGFNVDDFVADYVEHEGIFRDPFNDFKAELDDIQWGNKPTEAEMREFFDKHGNDVSGFIREHSINSYDGIEKETLLATLKLSDGTLVQLWNTFVEESAKYGADSYIYDLCHKKDVDFINKNFPKDKIGEITRIVRNGKLHHKDIRFFQWHNLNDDKINLIENIKNTIVAYWSDIFERVMVFPICYNDFGGFNYFTDVFWGACMKHLGYKYDDKNEELKKIEK